MSDTEKEVCRQIAIDLINEYRQQRCLKPTDFFPIHTPENSAFIRSIQLHEKTKQELADCKQELSDFRQEVSDAVEAYLKWCDECFIPKWDGFDRFVIPKPKPDPLVEALNEAAAKSSIDDNDFAAKIRAALAARGLEIREKNDG